MDNVIDLIATDASAAEISDKIKELMYAKAGERVEAIRPTVAPVSYTHLRAHET